MHADQRQNIASMDDAVWASSDYSPTAERLAPAAMKLADVVSSQVPESATVLDVGAGHGHLTELLMADGYKTLALEPVARMREAAEARLDEWVTWVDGIGESIDLPGASVGAVVSNFGAFLCDPAAGPAEWARVLTPGGFLAFTAWDRAGFLASMTDRMMLAMGAASDPPHMRWGDDDWATSQLVPHFDAVHVEHLSLPWSFESVAAGMKLYEAGSPTHSFSFSAAGPNADDLRRELRAHLEEHADPATGRIDESAGYSLITAWRE